MGFDRVIPREGVERISLLRSCVEDYEMKLVIPREGVESKHELPAGRNDESIRDPERGS